MKLPNEILIATNNKGKFFEIEALLSQINVKAIPTFQFNIEEPEETGETFAENSLLKAKFYGTKTGLFALADDSGLCVAALNGKPGIHSARFALDDKGEKNFPAAFTKIFAELKKNGVDFNDKPAAHFICNLALFDPKTNFEICFEGRIDGHLTLPKGNKGFGYDPIFVKNNMTQTFGEIAPEIKDQISHRAEAFKKMIHWLKNRV